MHASLLQRIDFFKLALNLGGNKATILSMLDLFTQSTAESLEKIEQAESARNTIIWLQTVHKMKGAAKNITARRLATLCEEAEEIQSLPHPQSSNVIYNMHKELALIREAIAAYAKAL
jgi:HPt (histidine-containing phosphotransfer) domain-containing protein